MIRLLIGFIVCLLPLLAQSTSNAASSASAPNPPATSPVPSAEPSVTGYIDLGWRWLTGINGSLDAYRAIVNLPSGPKMLGAEFTVTDPKKRLFDRLHLLATSWGDEPYETVNLDASKSKIYSFEGAYRDFAYYNFLPSYADPLMSRGIVLDEQSYETRKHLGSASLELFPSNWIVPYFDFEHDSGFGTGITTFVPNVNQYPVPENLNNTTNLYRGGVRFQLPRFHATLEEGGTTFRQGESLYSPGSTNYGNVLSPYLGQTLNLTGLAAGYGISGSSTYSKADLTASPTSWLDLFGQFMFSQPDTNVNYQQANTGNFVLQNQLLFYTGQEYLLTAAAEMPHTTASAGFELRPWRRLRITEAWLTDRLHNSGNASSTNQIFGPQTQSMAALLASALATNYSQNEVDIYFDPFSKLTLRGGYRYVWGNASDAILPPEGLASADEAKLRRNVGIVGFAFRPSSKLSLTGEAEGGTSGGVYFRTSLYNYEKANAQVRYQISGSLNATADFMLLENQNPIAGVNYTFRTLQESLSLMWLPSGGKFGDFDVSYSRSDLRSDIGYLQPESLAPGISLYTDNAHIGTGAFNLKLPHKLKLTTGGSFFISSGSRPTDYFLPMATLWVPVQKHATFFAEWTYYDYGEAFYAFEGFRTHMVVAGLRLSL